ncbi:thioesterase family protein [Bradyrhizobium cajani]|uniref:Thioesterase n=1 Tax=Bradyrhizobium cajani TaxID=1928661 RepID=A0A844TIA7_9BRAD|nr:thioesterase family protein [Bradyrhizobium cajani]MCP3371770.1 thioesterase family protein [Bradyrhizobium cajani]MVT76409.1 hypothetical protein [Bradyrhizobium cajani]
MPTLELSTAWLDFNGHLTERRFLQLCGSGTEYLLSHLGIGNEYRGRGSFYTLETHLSHLGELHAGDRVVVTTQVLSADEKRLHLFHVIRREFAEKPAATGEQMLIHVDAPTGRSAPVQGMVRERIQELAELHAHLPLPMQAGAGIRMRLSRTPTSATTREQVSR